jgi:hypothetical protein
VIRINDDARSVRGILRTEILDPGGGATQGHAPGPEHKAYRKENSKPAHGYYSFLRWYGKNRYKDIPFNTPLLKIPREGKHTNP